jgi:hypothetical protein
MTLTRLRIGAVIAVAATVGIVTWLLTRESGHPATTTGSVLHVVKPMGPVASTPRGLAGFSGALHQPIYWAGPIAGVRYELTETPSGAAYVRYLPSGVKVGERRASFLIVATYPFRNAMAALKRVANGRGKTLPDGAFVLPDATDPKSVHLAFPNVAYQVEVYDPVPARANRIAMSGRIRAVG